MKRGATVAVIRIKSGLRVGSLWLVIAALFMGIQAGSGPIPEPAGRSQDWIAPILRWLVEQRGIYAVPADHPRLRNISRSSVEAADVKQALVESTQGRWVQVGEVQALVPAWQRDPGVKELETAAHQFQSILDFLRSLTPRQREALQRGKVTPLSTFTQEQVLQLKEAFKARYGRGYPFPQSFPEGHFPGVRIILWPALRILVDGVEQPLCDFMALTAGPDFYDSYYYATIDEASGEIHPWGVENLLPEHLRGWDFPPEAAPEPAQETPAKAAESTSAARERPVHLPEAGVYPLSDLAARMSAVTQVEWVVDRRFSDFRFLLSKGDYPPETLSELCRRCYGLQIKHVGKVRFLTEGSVPLTGYHHDDLAMALHELTLPLLQWADEGVVYPGTGFSTQSYLERRRESLENLSDQEKRFVEDVWWVLQNWEVVSERFGYGYMAGRRQTAEKFYRHYASERPQSEGLSRLGKVEIRLEPLHAISVYVYEPTEFLTKMRQIDPDLRGREDLPDKLYEAWERYRLTLW